MTAPGLQLFAPYHIFGRMPSPPRDRPKPTTPEEEGIELYPDAMERLERAIKVAARHPPVKHPTARSKPGKTKKPRATRRP
jgi:hypothetical protein